MYAAYERLLNSYLNIVHKKYKTEELEKCCIFCEEIKHELYGMIMLMYEMNIITPDQYWKEHERIINTFSLYKLFNCRMEKSYQIF